MRTTDIANEMDLEVCSVSNLRRKHAPETVRKLDPSRWDDVNWNLQNIEIARQLGVSRQLVHITRKRRGKPIDESRDYVMDEDD